MPVSEYESDNSQDSLTWLSSQVPSDFTNGHASPVPVDHAKGVWGWQRKTLPLELVEQIFDFFFLENKAFEDIRPFSMASTQFRTVALRRYMSTLRIYSKGQLVSYTLMHYSIASRGSPHAYSGFDSITTLTRHLVACSSALMTSRWQPHLFRDLRSMHISLAEDGSRIQGSILNRILSKPTLPVMASRLTSLKMTGLWRIDVDLLSTVAKTFPGLTDLHLSCSENLDTSCCWLCYEESSMAVIHSPIPDHYANVKTLTVSLSTSTSLDVVKPHRMRSRRPFGRLSDWFICISEYFFRTKTWWTRTANTTTVLRSTNAHSSHLQRRTSQISQ